MTDNSRRSRYQFHRLALTPLIAPNATEALNNIKVELPKTDENQFLRFLLDNGLAPLWYELLSKNSDPTLISSDGLEELHRISLSAAATYLRQQHALQGLTAILETADIPHALFKGAHIRELIYENPAVRAACDIDILVTQKDRSRAIQALLGARFSFHPDPTNISHEGHLESINAALDLHWDILRPGRTRIDLTGIFLAGKEKFESHWGLSNEASLFIMLVHPVFTKYSTTPQAALIRLVDLVRWTRTRNIDWEKTATYLDMAGVKTAAWTTATWLAMLTNITLPEPFMKRITPGRVRTWYLRQWLAGNLSTRLLDHPVFVQLGFTLPAHDTWADACRAIKQARHEKKEAPRKTKELLQSINKDTYQVRQQ